MEVSGFDFVLGWEHNGTSRKRYFSVPAKGSFRDAVVQSLNEVFSEFPHAKFTGLTYFHPPIPPKQPRKKRH